MPAIGLRKILDRALQKGYAVGYFEAWDQYSLEAVIEMAEALEAPAILGFGAAVTSPAWLDAGGVEELATLARLLAERSTIPTAVLYNEAQTPVQAMRAIAAGCNCVMLDTSHLPWQENLTITRDFVTAAHAAGADVEAELGRLPNAGGPTREPGQVTDPEQAAYFVQATGIDALGVSVGNIHLLSEAEAALDLELLERIHRRVSVPLVLHGGTGIPAGAIRPAIAQGVVKVNYGTRLKQVFLTGVREAMMTLPEPANVHAFIGSRYDTDILMAGKRRMKELLGELIRLYGSAGQARSIPAVSSLKG
jgi:ketose-bisphosphate aldolase